MAPRKKSNKEIPLIKALANRDRPQANPLAVFKLARRHWMEGRRITIGDLAREIGVSRVTLYRWVGSKDRLIEEILWSFAKPGFESAVREAPGQGVDHIVEVHRRLMTDVANFKPIVRFIRENPTFAIRIQSKDPISAHGRIIQASAAHIGGQEAEGHIELTVNTMKMAEMIVYTNAALLYSAIIGDRSPATAIEQAGFIDRMLLLGKFSDQYRDS